MINFEIWDSLPQAVQAEHGPRLQAYFPMPTMDDPDWVDPEDGTQAPQVPKYTYPRWLDICVIKILANCSRKGQIIIDAENNVVTNPIE